MNRFRGLLLSSACYGPDTEGAGNPASPADAGTPGADTAADPAGQDPTPGAEADPSAAKDPSDDKQPKSLADAMAAALEDKDPSSDPANKDPKPKPDGADPAAKDPAADPRAAQDKELDKNPRFQAVTRERDAFKPDAEQYRNIKAYMDENGLKHEQVADALELSALLVNDPEKGLAVIEKIRETLNGTLGNTLPDDLKAKVDSGEMTEDAALEVSRARAKTNRADRRVESVTKSAQETKDAAAHEAHVTAIRSKVDGWEAQVAKTDPDFAKKRGLIGVMVRNILFARGDNFKDANDAEAVMRQAYVMANHQIKSLTPAPQARRGIIPSSGPRGTSIPASEPKSLGEAMSRALQ